MDKIRELVGLVTNHKEKVIDTFSVTESKQSVYNKFYCFLVENPDATDADCAKYLCNCGPGDKKYLMVKSRLRRKLMNTVYFFDIEKKDYSAYAKADFLCNKLLAASGILIGLGAYRSILQQVNKGLYTADKFHMNKYAAEFCRLLVIFYSQKGDIKKTLYYSNLNAKYTAYQICENSLVNFGSYIIANFRSSATQKPYLAKEIKSFLAVHEPTEPEGINQSFMYAITKYRVCLALYQLEHNYIDCIALCSKAIAFVENAPVHLYNKKLLAEFYIMKLGACAELGENNEGISTAKAYTKIADKNSAAWLLMSEYYFVFLLKTADYTGAFKLYNEVIAHNLYKTRPENTKEKWRIFKYHLQFIAEAGWEETFSNQFLKAHSQKLRPTKIINDLEIFIKDKSGLYVSILL